MRNSIQKFFTTTSITVAGIKFCVALAMLIAPVLLMNKAQYLDHMPAYLLTSSFITTPFLIQSFCQLGRAFRASPNKWIGVILGCMLFGAIQVSVALLFSLFGVITLLVTLNFSSAAEVMNRMFSYIKASFKWSPQDSTEKPAHAAVLAPSALKKDEKNKAKEVTVPITAMPENMTDYASYLENLSRK